MGTHFLKIKAIEKQKRRESRGRYYTGNNCLGYIWHGLGKHEHQTGEKNYNTYMKLNSYV